MLITRSIVRLRSHDRGTAPGHDVELDVRCSGGNLLHQRRRQKFDREIGHHQAKAPLAPDGIEIIRNKKSAYLIEGLGKGPAQRQSPRRQFHVRADTHQQGVAECAPQPLQCVARGRLRQADAHRGAADICFEQKRVKRDEQVEIERG